MDDLDKPGATAHNSLPKRLFGESLGLQHARARDAVDADDARLCSEHMLPLRKLLH